jgi:hypothetical protein
MSQRRAFRRDPASVRSRIDTARAAVVAALLFLGAADALSAELIARYPFNETAGPVRNDSVGIDTVATESGGAGYLYNAAPVPAGSYGSLTVAPGALGASGGSAGSGTWATGPNNEFGGLINDFTVMAWLKIDATAARQRIIGTNTSAQLGWSFGVDAAGKLVLSGYGVADVVSTNGYVFAQTWVHVAASKSSVNGVTFFVNDELVQNFAAQTGNWQPSSAPFWLLGNLDNESLSGLVDDIRIYRGTLDAAGIRTALDTVFASGFQYLGLGDVVGVATIAVPRVDACQNSQGRTCESLIGNTVTDAMRQATGADFAITNSGGLRADLTCPGLDNPNDTCPPYAPPPYPITRGQVLAVLPFGNVVETVLVNGAELKTMLENGVSQMPAIAPRFPEVSGLCFTYDVSAAAGSRVTSAVRQAQTGGCTGTAIDFAATAAYVIAENDFMATGGDGYPNFAGRPTKGARLDQIVSDYVTAHSPITPVIEGRIVCTSSGVTACPVQ